MKVIFYFPPGTIFAPSLENYRLWTAYAGDARAMLFDKSLVNFEIVPEEPTPPPTPTPPETELYKVVIQQRLNVRVDHSTSAEIRRRLNPGEEFPLEVGAAFDDTANRILWRKTVPDGYWVAVEVKGQVYAEKVDTSGRAG